MPEMQIAGNIARVRERMAQAAARRGVPAESIVLLGVTKTVDAARITNAYDAGLRDFGENYVQEALTKVDRPELHWPDARWHFIGHLQSNKARDVAGRFALVQSIDSLNLAKELAKRSRAAGTNANILLEINLDPTGTKFGFPPATLPEVVEQIAAIPGLILQGLMGIAPYTDNPETVRPVFRKLHKLFTTLPNAAQQTLSMGMTGDFEVAIEEGATLIRIGTALFGPRTNREG